MENIRDATVAQLADYDDIIDVRSPAEYAEDHIPGAINAPVLSDAERALVGTLYAQVSPFEAKKCGAALVAQNIARHLETLFHDKPKQWRPLVYCWRGGQRSGAMSHILGQVGWRVGKLTGGYKAYRRHVIAELEHLPASFQFRVICGATGSGKSRLLQVLQGRGAQALDLEHLAQHRGSLLGNLPHQAQPSQKMFETRLWDTLRHFEPQHPVFVEAESRKIGTLSLPVTLLEKIRASECIVIEAPLPARIGLLLEEYEHFLHDPDLLVKRLTPLIALHGRKVIDEWNALARSGDWTILVEQLLTYHYDPAYRRSTKTNFPALAQARVLRMDTLDIGQLHQVAAPLLQNADLAES